MHEVKESKEEGRKERSKVCKCEHTPPRSPSWQCGGTESCLMKLILKAHEWYKLCKGRVVTSIVLFCLLPSTDYSDSTSDIRSCIGCLGWPNFVLNSCLCLKVGTWQMPICICRMNDYQKQTVSESTGKKAISMPTLEEKIKFILSINFLLSCHQLINFSLRWSGCKVKSFKHLVLYTSK